MSFFRAYIIMGGRETERSAPAGGGKEDRGPETMAAELKRFNLICGDEQYLKEKKKKELLRALHTEGSMNFNAFEGKDLDRDEVLRLGNTMPFLSDRRTILLTDSGLFRGAVPEALLEELSALPESTVLIFYEGETEAGNRLYKFVKEKGEVFRYQKAESLSFKEAAQDQTKIRSWAQNYLKKNHRELSGRAMTRLLQLTGYDMLNLQTELEKLISYTASPEELAGGGTAGHGTPGGGGNVLPIVEIREQDIEAICSKTVSDKVFDMLSAKLKGNMGEALRLFEDLLSLKVPPMRVLFLLSRQFNQVYLLKELSRERIGDGELAEKLKLKDWQLRKLKEQSQRVSLSEARRYLELCVEMETKIKQGDMNEKLGLEIILAS